MFNQSPTTQPLLQFLHCLNEVDRRSLWHGVLPKSIRPFFCEDQLQAINCLSKLTTPIITKLYKLWIARCQIVHKRFADGLEIEERIDLMREVLDLINNGQHHNYPPQFRNLTPSPVNCLSNPDLKGVLFACCSAIGDVQLH